MRLVIIESPYAGNIELNVRYARACLRHSLSLGEAPIASHLLYTQPGVLDDSIEIERRLGMIAGREWMTRADAVIVCIDLGVSKGMSEALARAKQLDKPSEFRKLPLEFWVSRCP